MNSLFSLELLKEAEDFIESLDAKSKDKILYNMKMASLKPDSNLFKHLEDDIWYFRTFYRKQKFRIFAFWFKDKNRQTLVIATHGIIKKTDKASKQEIERAKEIRRKYLISKNLLK